MRHTKWAVRAMAVAVATSVLSVASASADDDATKRAALTNESKATLDRCKAMSDACTKATNAAAGVLVFPEVTKASFIVGGSGAKGVLWVNGKVAGYYGMGEGSVGFQAGVKKSSQVYALNEKSFAALRDSGSWKIGTDAEVTVIGEGANDSTVAGTGGTAVFVFDEKGLSAGVSVEGVRIEKIENDDF